MGAGASNEPGDTDYFQQQQAPVAEINSGSSRIITSGADLSKFLPEIAALIVRQKAGKAELASTLAKNQAEASRIVNTPIGGGDYSGLLLLHVIALYGIDDDEAAKIIIQLTNDINAMVRPEENHYGGSALHLCALTNNTAIATHILMLRTDAVIDLRDYFGFAPVHRAVLSGSTSFARLVLRRYPELINQTVNSNTETAGEMAEMNYLHLAVIAALQNHQKQRPSLYHFVDFLIKHGADVNATDIGAGATPIHYAAARGVTDLLYLMLNSRDVKDSIDDSAGLNALHVAALSNQLVSIKMLIMRGFDVNSRGARGETPIMTAAMSNSIEAVRLLIEKGADPKVVDNTGASTLHYAAATASPDTIFEILNLTEIDINAVDLQGGTALHTLALRYDSLPTDVAQKACQVLIDFGIDVNIVDDFGNRAYKYMPADDAEAQTLFGKSHLFAYDNFHDRSLEEENQVRLPIGLPRLPVSRNWLQEMVKVYGQGAEEEYQRDFEQRMYYFPGEPRRTPPMEREPEWWSSEATFPYSEANKVLADRHDVGPRYPAAVIPLGPHPLQESFDNIAPNNDEMGNAIPKPWQRDEGRNHQPPTKSRPDRRTIEETQDELLKRNYISELLDEINREEQQYLDARHRHKWWMRSDVRNGIDRMPAHERPPSYVPGMSKDEMLLHPEIEFPPDVDIKKITTDEVDVPNKTPEAWMREQVIDDRTARIRRPPTANRARGAPAPPPETAVPVAPAPSQQPLQRALPPAQNEQPKTVVLYAPNGQQVPVIARPEGQPDVRVIANPADGKPIQVVEGPDGIAYRVYEAPNGKPVIMAGRDGRSAIVAGPDGNPIRFGNRPENDGRNSAATSSVISSRFGTPRSKYLVDPDDQPTKNAFEQDRAMFGV